MLAVASALVLPAAAAAANGSISGTIRNANTHARVAGVNACVHQAVDSIYNSSINRCELTDANGEYTVTNLPPGEYKVQLEAHGANVLSGYAEGAGGWDDATVITVYEGKTVSGVDTSLPEAGRIEGTVVDAATGNPVAGVVACPRRDFPSIPAWRCGVSDEDGHYEMHGLEAGKTGVMFDPPEASDYVHQFYPGTLEEQYPIDVVLGEVVTGIDAELTIGGRIEGTVSYPLGGGPFWGAFACAAPLQPTPRQTAYCGKSGKDGRFAIRGAPSDEYIVLFTYYEPGVCEPHIMSRYYGGSLEAAEENPISVTAPGIVTGIDTEVEVRGDEKPPCYFQRDPTPTAAPDSETGTDLESESPAPGGSDAPFVAPAVQSTAVTGAAPVVRCRRGFKARKVDGKRRCVKAGKHHRRQH